MVAGGINVSSSSFPGLVNLKKEHESRAEWPFFNIPQTVPQFSFRNKQTKKAQ
jgi:hypothetical protein